MNTFCMLWKAKIGADVKAFIKKVKLLLMNCVPHKLRVTLQ